MLLWTFSTTVKISLPNAHVLQYLKAKKKVLKRGNRKRENIPFVFVGCPGVAGIAWSGPEPASPAHWDSERGLSLIHCPPAPAESPKKKQTMYQKTFNKTFLNKGVGQR